MWLNVKIYTIGLSYKGRVRFTKSSDPPEFLKSNERPPVCSTLFILDVIQTGCIEFIKLILNLRHLFMLMNSLISLITLKSIYTYTNLFKLDEYYTSLRASHLNT